MTADKDSNAAPLCPTCGAPLRPDAACDFDRAEDDSPAHGDYAAMHRGLMTHEEHLIVVARWSVHNAQAHGPAVLQRYRPVVQAAWGRPQALFPLES